MRFLIGMVGYGRNGHTRCFEDFAMALAAALRDLGHEVEAASPEAKPGRLIMFGANNLRDDPRNPRIPADAIIFNSEQLAAVQDPTYFLQNYIQYRQMTVWDYSLANIAALKKLGIKNAVHCPLGYHPSMEKIPRTEKDLDVLFYGSLDGPRREVLDAFDRAGLQVTHLFGTYGAERDAYIARAKIVLNIHYYPNPVFEIFRVSHLLANAACVVTESGGCDESLENLARRTCAYVPRDQLIATCKQLVDSLEDRAMIAFRGYHVFKQLDLVAHVRRALEQS